MSEPVIKPTDKMKAAFRAARDRRAEELVAEGAPLGGHGILDQSLAAVLAIVERETVRPMLELIRDLTDRDECWFDHHGGCQAHGYLSLEPGEKCPHAQAKELLAGHGVKI